MHFDTNNIGAAKTALTVTVWQHRTASRDIAQLNAHAYSINLSKGNYEIFALCVAFFSFSCQAGSINSLMVILRRLSNFLLTCEWYMVGTVCHVLLNFVPRLVPLKRTISECSIGTWISLQKFSHNIWLFFIWIQSMNFQYRKLYVRNDTMDK